MEHQIDLGPQPAQRASKSRILVHISTDGRQTAASWWRRAVPFGVPSIQGRYLARLELQIQQLHRFVSDGRSPVHSPWLDRLDDSANGPLGFLFNLQYLYALRTKLGLVVNTSREYR